MRALVLLVVGASLLGCSTDMSGLGGDLPADATSGDTTVVDEDDTAPLFPDEDSSADTKLADSGVVETTVDTAGHDTASVDDTAVDDTGADTGAADTDTVVDSGPTDSGTPDDTAADTAVDTGFDAGGPVASTPGKVSCYQSGSAKQCDTNFCCGSVSLSGVTWQCADGCGIFGAGAYDYACDEKADCSGSNVCCVTTTIVGWAGSSCKSSCGSDPQLCAFTAECPSGKTCQAVKPPSAPFTYGQCK